MMGKIHSFNLKVGGGYTMSLFYTDKETKGKTSGNEDRSTIKFIELNPYESIVQTVNFQSDRNEFTGQMTMEILLKENNSASTMITIIFKNIPKGIAIKDNETGTEQSLEKLAKYLTQKNK